MKRSFWIALVFLVLVVLVSLNTLGLAAEATDNVTANVYIAEGVELTVADNLVEWGSAGTPLTAFTSGIIAPTIPADKYLNISVRCNVATGYELVVSAGDLTGAGGVITANQLLFNTVDNSGSAEAGGLTVTASGAPTAGTDYDLYTWLNLTGDEVAGTYTGVITVTLTSM